jgi:hypothetical protein
MLSSLHFCIGVALAAMKRSSIALVAFGALAACGEEPPPHSVTEFVADPILLEATMVRCGQDRAASRYDAECINARDAVDSIAKAEEEARRQELEAESERKRQVLRRARQAAAEARQRAQEAQRKREEAAYYGEFEPLPSEEDPVGAAEQDDPEEGSQVESHPDTPPAASAIAADEPPSLAAQPAQPAPDLVSAPEQGSEAAGTELETVREELRRREEEAQN